MPFLRILSWLLLGAACLLWAAALGFVVLWPRHPTGARQLHWRDANGQALASAPSTCGQDTRFPLLVQQNRVWLPCPAAPDLPGGAIALLEPARGEARLVAPLPERLPLERVEGLLPGSGGTVGLVYRASSPPQSGGVAEVLVAGVMNDEGWQVPPERLPGGAGSRLLGLGWSGRQLEVALAPARGEDTHAEAADAVVVRVGDTELPFTVTREEMCLFLQDCAVRVAYRAAQAGWRFLVEDGGTLREVRETGAGEAEGRSVELLAGLDLRVAGRLRPPNLPPLYRLEPDGTILPSEPRPSGRHSLPAPAMADGSRLVPLSRALPEQGSGVVHEWEDQHWHTAAAPDGTLRVEGGTGAPAAVARLDGPCTRLASGFLVPLRRGLTLLTPDGCYVGLTRSGQREDPLNLFEHLERIHVPHAVPALLWILLGCPMLLLPPALLQWPRAPGHRRLASGLLSACYLFSALPLIPWLLPLLS